MKKRKNRLGSIMATMAIIAVLAIGLSQNQQYIREFAMNFSVIKALVRLETGVIMSFHEFEDFYETITESNFIPTPNEKPNIDTIKTSVSIKNNTSKKYDINKMLEDEFDLNIKKNSKDPQILIVHTHGSESYMKTGVYVETSDKRTDNPKYNVLAVGDILADNLNDRGINTIVSTNLHDYPEYSGAYNRTLETIEEYKEKYPSIKMVIDVHRDAIIGSDGSHLKSVVDINGKSSAQIMMVIGTDEGGLLHPEWQDNLNVAVNLQDHINENVDGLLKAINLRDSRFNQHVTKGSMILEVGTSGNTLDEAKNAIDAFSKQLAEFLLK